MGKRIDIGALQPGMVIVRITAQNGPVKIRKSGLVSSQEMVIGLAEMGVQEVEIDPAQTVELADEAEDVSAQAPQSERLLLSRQTGITSGSGQVDHHLSEQFNRTLLLPSAQSVPGMMKLYARPVLSAVLIAAGGVSIGWNLAHSSDWVDVAKKLTQPDKQVVYLPAPQSPTPAPVTSPADTPVTEPVNSGVVDEGETLANAADADDVTQQPEASGTGDLARAEGEPEPIASISPVLLERFERAIAEVDSQNDSTYEQPAVSTVNAAPDVPAVHELPAWLLTELPSMEFSAHMYASNPSDRWIRINGKRLVEGQNIEGELRLVAIEPQHVVLAFKGHEFSMNALTDW